MSEDLKHLFDAGAFTILLMWFAEALPAIATLLTIVWSGIRIYETDTVQRWIKRRRKPPAA